MNADALSFSFHAVMRCLERGITEQNELDTYRHGCVMDDAGERTVFARGRMRVVVADGLFAEGHTADAAGAAVNKDSKP